MKAIFGAGVVREIHKKVFKLYEKNYVAERDVKIRIEKLWQRKERPL